MAPLRRACSPRFKLLEQQLLCPPQAKSSRELERWLQAL